MHVTPPLSSLLDATAINGTPYSYEVVAHNAAGFSSTPASVGPVTPNLAFRNVQQPITVTRPAGDLVHDPGVQRRAEHLPRRGPGTR